MSPDVEAEHVFHPTTSFSLHHVDSHLQNMFLLNYNSSCIMQHTVVWSIVLKQRNSNVTFAACVRDVKLTAVRWHEATPVICFVCTGMAEYEFIRAFESDKAGLMVCHLQPPPQYNTVICFSSMWLMFIPSGPVTSCSCVNNGITHWLSSCCLTLIKTLYTETLLIVPSEFCIWITE